MNSRIPEQPAITLAGSARTQVQLGQRRRPSVAGVPHAEEPFDGQEPTAMPGGADPRAAVSVVSHVLP